LVERSASVVGVKAREKGLELLYRVAPGTHTAVRGDPDRLQQVLTNLLGNAVKFTEEGQVVLTVEAEPGASPNGEEGVVLRFSVMDTGIGIPGEKHDIVFESFTQADSSTTRRYGGTGLGLAISRRLVELMGGRIWLESEVGRGSTFRVALPFETADLPGAERAEGVSDLEGCHMLVVDDNPTNRLILREMLGGWGATVDEAEDGLQGVDKLTRASSEGTTYDVVVLDNRMPNMDGMGFLEIVRGDEALSGVGVVMLSSEAGTNLLERLRPLGVTDYLTKPVRRSDLHDALVHAASVTRASEMAEEVSAPAVLESPTDTRPLRIMLVDDSEDNRFLVEAHLSKLPYTLHTAEDGQAAVDRFEQSEGGYDLILMDMQMPVMDGYDATRAIRLLEAERSWPRTSIVALTAYALNEESQRSIDAGCDGHLAKPIKKRALLDAIIHYTGGGSDE
jgi:CheY-like chemotaxis protein